MGLLKFLYRSVRNFLIVFFTIVLLPGLPPKTDFGFTSFNIEKSLDLKGPLEVNNLLDNTQHLFEGQVHGPEALIARGNEIFATVLGGQIIKISGNHVTHVAKIGQPCENIRDLELCGRPLGLAFDVSPNHLIVADSYYGIWQVDISNGKKVALVSPSEVIGEKNSRPAKIFNGIAVTKNGDIYWTDSSSDFGLEDGLFTLFANPSGRLIHFNRSTKKNTVLLDNLFFANGLALSPEEDFILVSETGASRIQRYYLKGPKAGQSDVFVDRLPGSTDNLTPDASGVWVPLVIAVDADHPAIWQTAANAPLFRKFLIRVLALIELPFRLIQNVYPNEYCEKAVRAVGNLEYLSGVIPPRTTVVRVNWSGKIVGSLHGFDKSIQHVAHVLPFGEYLYLGSYRNDFLGLVRLPPTYKKSEPQVEAPKPTTTTTTTTPKPTTTTTTPKPTTTTTPKPTTTTTTTPKPTTTTTAPPPAQKPTQKPTEKATPSTPKPQAAKPVETPKPAPAKPREPAPVHEVDPKDAKKVPQEKLKVIKKGGDHGEL